MPIKWTAEVDQILLLKIIETSNINADSKAISEAWPSNMEKPTPRAISERLAKIRNTAKTAGNTTHLSISKKPGTPTATPKKRAPAASANSAKKPTTKKAATKANGEASRKRGRDSTDDDESGGEGFKTDGNGTNASDDEESPSKKPRTRGRNVIKLEDDDETEDERVEAPVFA